LHAQETDGCEIAPQESAPVHALYSSMPPEAPTVPQAAAQPFTTSQVPSLARHTWVAAAYDWSLH
jgi:hypothetical protein